MGVPKFRPGEEHVLFMAGRSAIGFSSPIGLSQGKFHVEREGGRAKVGNGRDFKEMIGEADLQVPGALKEKIKSASGRVTDLDLEEFKLLVRQRVGGKR